MAKIIKFADHSQSISPNNKIATIHDLVIVKKNLMELNQLLEEHLKNNKCP